MHKILIFLIVISSFISCKVTEKPEFLRLENVTVIESTPKYVKLKADAFFNNPNHVGGTLKTDGIKILINDNEVAYVSSEAFQVPSQKTFSIPLQAKIATDSIFSNKSLSGLLGSILSRKIKVQYQGEIKYRVYGFSHTYKLDETENVQIK